jgi:hypothetical protein
MLRNSIFATCTLVMLVVACSDNNHPAAQVPEAGPICPASAKTAEGSACSREGYSCAVGYECTGGVWQQAACTCTAGKYTCKDATGNDVDPMNGPQCAPTPPPSETCSSVMAMDGKDCMTAGFACYFMGVTCQNENGGKPYTDVCLCAPRQNGPLPDGSSPKRGLAWNCEVHMCSM